MKSQSLVFSLVFSLALVVFAGDAVAASEPLEGSRPDYIVYRPQQPRGGKNADPTKRGDCYNDHFQVIWDDARKLYYAFWTQGSGEGYGDMHVCLSKSADRGKTWTYPKLIAGGEKIAEPKPRAVWQQPMLAKSGRLYCLWNQQVNDEKLHHGAMYGAYSDDGGETWSKPEENKSIPRQYRDDWKGISLPSWCNWQRPLRLAENDKFLVACTRHGTGRGEPHRSLAIEFWRFENIDDNPEIRDIRITVLSGGKDAIRVPVPGEEERYICEEAGIVKLPDGRLFALMRTRHRHPYWVQSRDNGVTWSKPEPLRDKQGVAYLHPCSPCPIYDVNGCEAASGEYVAFIHNAYDDSIPPLGKHERGPVYMLRGRFDPTGAQPIAFDAPELFSAVKTGNSYYASFTHADGEGVMWFAHQKHFLIGRKIVPSQPLPEKGRLIAHRGESLEAPENTLEAFRRAFADGFGAELDLYMSLDGEVYLTHNYSIATMEKGCGIAKLPTNCCWKGELDRAEAALARGKEWKGTPFARIDDVLAIAPSNVLLYLDVKDPRPEILPLIRQAVDRHPQIRDENLVFLTARGKRLFPKSSALRCQLARRGWKKDDAPIPREQILATLRKSSFDGLDVRWDREIVTADFVKFFKDAGYSVHVWTVNDLEDVALAFERGVSTVTTDSPRRILSLWHETFDIKRP